MSHVFTVSFHPSDDSWLANARRHDRRISLAELAIDAVSGGDEPALVALPAGFLRVGSEEACNRLADSLLDLSRRAQVALTFGVDVAPEGEWAPLAGPNDTFAFACDTGSRVLWPAKQVRASPARRSRRPEESRCVELAGQKVGIVISGEAFNAPLRLALTQAIPDLILVLAHAAPTDRWAGAVASLHTIAPTFVIAPCAPNARRGPEDWISEAPHCWRQDCVAETAEMTIRRYRENCELCDWSQSTEDAARKPD